MAAASARGTSLKKRGGPGGRRAGVAGSAGVWAVVACVAAAVVGVCLRGSALGSGNGGFPGENSTQIEAQRAIDAAGDAAAAAVGEPTLAPAPYRPVVPPVSWYAPFWSGGGYCSEAIAFVTELQKHTQVQIVHHGDSKSYEFAAGLEPKTLATLKRLMEYHKKPENSVVVCHSEPGAWHPSKYPTSPCPNPEVDYRYRVGRTMFETDRLPSGWSERLNRMDEVWVPTEFHRQVFERGGVHRRRLRVVPEPVDTNFFHPARARPYPLPGSPGPDKFKFLSVFKWEERKGWRFLLEAFLREFTRADRCALYILTNAYHSDSEFGAKIAQYVKELNLTQAEAPEIHVLPEGIPTRDMPSVYKAADAFVLPSRGEGWGRPHVEAMSMALPVIATHWSGPTEYLSAEVGYPLEIEGLEPVASGPFKGHLWARPSVPALRRLMRRVMVARSESKQLGLRARQLMVERYCLECVGRLVVDEFKRIDAELAERSRAWAERAASAGAKAEPAAGANEAVRT